MTNESHRYNGWTPTLQLHGDASNAVLRAVDEGTLLCIRCIAANPEIRFGRYFYRKAQHAAQQNQGAEAQRERAIHDPLSNRCRLRRSPCTGCHWRQYDGSGDRGSFRLGQVT
jgi:hypothetical protein